MPIFSGFLIIFRKSGVIAVGGGQLYREIFRKHWISEDFAYRGARRSSSYVNMVKVGFHSGEMRCQVTRAQALAG